MWEDFIKTVSLLQMTRLTEVHQLLGHFYFHCFLPLNPSNTELKHFCVKHGYVVWFHFCKNVSVNVSACSSIPKDIHGMVVAVLHVWLFCDPMDCSPPGSSVHGDFPGENPGSARHFLLQGIFPTLESNPGLLHFRRIPYHWTTREAYIWRYIQWSSFKSEYW